MVAGLSANGTFFFAGMGLIPTSELQTAGHKRA